MTDPEKDALQAEALKGTAPEAQAPEAPTLEAEAAKKSAANKERIFADLKSTTERISETSRYIGYGLSAVALTLYSAETELSSSLLKISRNYILLAASLGIGTVIFDYFQFLMGYCSSYTVYETSKGKDSATWEYPKNSKLRKARFFFFYGKQVFAVVGSGFLLFAFACALMATPDSKKGASAAPDPSRIPAVPAVPAVQK